MRLTPKQEKFLEIYKLKGGNISEACKAAGISRETHYAWLKSDNLDDSGQKISYKQAFDEATETLYDFVESKLMQSINDGNVRSIIFYCETRLKQRGFVKKIETAHSGAMNVNTMHTDKEAIEAFIKKALE